MNPNKLVNGHYELTEEKHEALNNRFKHHPPTQGQPERYHELRNSGKILASIILQCVPDGREQSIALTKIEEAIFFANAGIARNEKD